MDISLVFGNFTNYHEILSDQYSKTIETVRIRSNDRFLLIHLFTNYTKLYKTVECGNEYWAISLFKYLQ